MRPRFYPSLVNGAFGDAALYIDLLMERRAILFDLGDISPLQPRSVLRVSDIFVTHTHIDHFAGFDRLLRLLVGRPKTVRLYGPPGFIRNVEGKLAAYTWNLVDRFAEDLVFRVTELDGTAQARRVRLRLKARFAREAEESFAVTDGILRDEPSLKVRCAVLDHRTPCLAFAIEEPTHVNIWRNRLDEMGLPTGPWLAGLKRAIHEERPDDTPVALPGGGTLPLGELRGSVVSETPGQKIAYVTDAAFTPSNADAIVALARGADVLFIEAGFPEADAAVAADRAHLTATQAGTLARRAGVRAVEPFHFSPRYHDREDALRAEVAAAFAAGC